MRYVVLLRGINVGGNRRVPKTEFKTILESLGCKDVVVYINSGNAVFSADRNITAHQIQQALEVHFGFGIPTLVLSGENIKAIAGAIPQEWTNDQLFPDKSGQKSDVVYLFDEINDSNILQIVGYDPDIETMIYIDGAILANITRANQGKGSLQKLIGRKLYNSMTIRNIATAKKLAELVE